MTTPDFEKMFDIDGFLNSDDQIRYAKAVRAFADAVENIMGHLGVSRNDPHCAALVEIAQDLFHARRDAEQEAIRATEQVKELTTRLRAARGHTEEGVRESIDKYVKEQLLSVSKIRTAIVALWLCIAVMTGVLGFTGGWYAHELQRQMWDPPPQGWQSVGADGCPA
jgi:hypothetical protein